MNLVKFPSTFLLPLAVAFFCLRGLCDDTKVSVKFSKAPHAFSHLTTATFAFQVMVGGNESTCTGCEVTCQLDGRPASDCGARYVLYEDLQDGNHSFVVCINEFQGVGCSTYNWTVDTVPPTANISALSAFTNALNVSVNISFSELCTGGGGFACPSVNACNLLVYGPGQVIPSSLTVLQPNLKYSLLVSLSPTPVYGRVVLVMDKNFCTDFAGNLFTRSSNSSLFVHFDRRSVSVDLRTHVPKKSLKLANETRIVQATNKDDNLKVYLYSSEPVLNTTSEILDSLNTNEGGIFPISGEDHGNRRFGFQVDNISSSFAVITIGLQSNSILSRSGTPVSPIAPVTFLYDSQRPIVRLSTTSNTRTREHIIPVSINFMKPVFGFNSSSLLISGGHLQSFHEISWSQYVAEIQADKEIVSINVPQNVTADVAGNKNLVSNTLQVKHYDIPKVSSVSSILVTACFLATSSAAGLLTLSTASLQAIGAFSRPPSLLIVEPTKSLFRSTCHIQFFALSRWLPVTLPVEYHEFTRGLQWSIPYFHLPWETGGSNQIMVGSNASANPHSYISKVECLGTSDSTKLEEVSTVAATAVPGLPLTPAEYRLYFESQIYNPEAEYIVDSQISNGWRDFDRSMFWLAVIGGSLLLLHALLLMVLRFKKKDSEKKRGYGALTFPRFEIFLIMLALPCLCESAASVIKGGTRSGSIVGILLLVVVGLLLLALFLFLSVGITLGRLLQYKEVHQVGQKFHWYQELVRVTLGPGKRGQWTWKNEQNFICLTKFGPLFEDLRGPPKYMLSQISGGNLGKRTDRIIASDDEIEDAEAPYIQKLFGILRIYYTLFESVKRVSLGIVAGVYSNNWSSKSGIAIIWSIASFQLFFLLLKKPFIKKKVQLVEIISIACQVVIVITCFVLLEKVISTKNETAVGIFMLVVFLIGFLAQMINEWYALFKQTKQLDPVEKSFLTGLRTALIGLLLLLIPSRLSQNLKSKLPQNLQGDKEALGENSSSADRIRSSGSRSSGTPPDKPWLKQLREMAKASFTKEGGAGPSDPSTSRTKWSGFWSTKRSGSSSQGSSDSKSKPSRLHKDLEAIFASR